MYLSIYTHTHTHHPHVCIHMQADTAGDLAYIYAGGVYVCIYICVYVYMYVCIYVCIYTYTYACIHVCIYIRWRTCIHIYTHTYIYMHMCVCIRRCINRKKYLTHTHDPFAHFNIRADTIGELAGICIYIYTYVYYICIYMKISYIYYIYMICRLLEIVGLFMQNIVSFIGFFCKRDP